MTTVDPQRHLGEGGRYRLDRRLGAGGMGVVHAAFDSQRGAEVALKTLREHDPDALYRFKQEFRALADVHHENLVSLYDLVAEGDQWFFTMELVDGVDFVTWVRGPKKIPAEMTAETIDVSLASARSVVPATATRSGASDSRPRKPEHRDDRTADLGRLRAALPQLVAGVMALHRSGHLHRDIKPSNVLVTPAGRVVLLDFGVVATLGTSRSQAGKEIVGTPAYMAPEQAQGEPPQEASDWYSVGILLYEALTGLKPFAGGTSRVLADKLEHVPPPPRVSGVEIPADLDALCADLLQLDPAKRPRGEEILERAGVRDRSLTPSPRPSFEDVTLFGRHKALQQLRDAFADARSGSPRMTVVRGQSGSGKTALVQRFLRHTEAFGALLLRGRCYERESVPFKALDPIVDELCSWLLTVEPEQRSELLPPDAPLLAKLFPVMARIESLRGAAVKAPATDPTETRRRAGVALRELMTRVAALRPTVLFIDDLQWGDADSAPLIDRLLRPPSPPAITWILCVREVARPGPLVGALARFARSIRTDTLEIGPLPRVDAIALARHVLTQQGASASAALEIAAEAQGNPFFIRELALAASTPGQAWEGRVELGAFVRRRVAALSEADRRLIETVAIASRPVQERVAFEAARLRGNEQVGVVPRLVRMHLLRSSAVDGQLELECYHDRIRESVFEMVEPERRALWHRRLATALEESDAIEPETLVEHWRGAGQPDKAFNYAIEAARNAAKALAFERAASLFRTALELRPSSEPGSAALLVELGDALGNAGHGGDAADTFLSALELVDDPDERHALRQRAAEQLLRSGHVERGLPLLRDVLRKYGLKVPSSTISTLAAFATQRALLKVRGLDFTRRDRSQLPADRIALAEACWGAATGLVQLEPLMGAAFSTRHVRLALDLGDPIRIARAILLEGIVVSSGGSKTRASTEKLLGIGTELSRELEDRGLEFFCHAAWGVAYMELGEYGKSWERCQRGLAMSDAAPAGSYWELGTLQLFSSLTGLFSGQFEPVGIQVPEYVSDARQRGDVYTLACLRTSASPMLGIIAGHAEEALAEVDEALALWGRNHIFENQHYMAFVGKACAYLYQDDLDGMLELCTRTDEGMRGSLLSHVQLIRGTWRLLRSMCRLRAAHEEGPRGRHANMIAGDARKLAREGVHWCKGAAASLRAGLALLEGDRERARSDLTRAVALFGEAEFNLIGVPSQWSLGALTGGSEGRAMQESALAYLRDRGVADPARYAAAFAPPVVGREQKRDLAARRR